MSAIKEQFGAGGSGITPYTGMGDDPTLAAALRGIADDVAVLRAAIVALTAKMDTDFTAQNLVVTASQLDEDYATAVDPIAMVTTKA